MTWRHYLKVGYITLMVLALYPVNTLGRALLRLRLWRGGGPHQGVDAGTGGQQRGGASHPAVPPPPIFVLGHYRSGTSFLYQMLATDPEVTGLTMHQCWWPAAFPSLITRAIAKNCLPQHRPMDDVRCKAILPIFATEGDVRVPLSLSTGVLLPTPARHVVAQHAPLAALR